MEQRYNPSESVGPPQTIVPPQANYYGQYPVNPVQMNPPHFNYNYPTLNNSNYSLSGTSDKSYINQNFTPNLMPPSSESTGLLIDFSSGTSANDNLKSNAKSVMESSPNFRANGEFPMDSQNTTAESEGVLGTSDESLKPDQTQQNKEVSKGEKANRQLAGSVQKPRLSKQNVGTNRNIVKTHTSSRHKKKHDLSTDSANENLQQPNPFEQWYQMMSQYYSQFYPGYQMVQPPTLPHQSAAFRSPNQGAKPSSQPVNIPQHEPQGFKMPSGNQTGTFDYANYYYQYYAAAQLWSGAHAQQLFGTGIPETPRFYNSPHIRAWMGCPGVIVQILPSRPLDGELARVEIIDLSELANEAAADASKRAAYNTCSTFINTRDPVFSQQQSSEQASHFGIDDSGRQTPSHLSSIPAGGGDEDTEEMRACAAITACWDRTDHLFYPGPLDRVGTLKADVLAFLREKLSEIQDRLPIDWESADLLLMFLEALVKNNGNLQTSDLVNLLLEGHEPTTSSYRSGSYGYSSSSYLGVQVPSHYAAALNSFSQVEGYINESLNSLPGSQMPSGRESPESHFEVDYRTSFMRHNKAASETGGPNSAQSIIRRVGAMNIGSRNQESEDKILDRFRELLMHGLPMKALEHACRSKLWGHAFTLAHRMGPPIFAKVMDRFLNNAVPISDPILTLYQLTAGDMPQVINTAAYGKGSDSGDWRPHLAMILAAQSTQLELSLTALERLGDGLLSRKHIYAAHLCYLLTNTLKQADKSELNQKEYRLPAKIWLIGVPPHSDNMNADNTGVGSSQPASPLFSTSEAIQLTEIYEYAIQLANRKYRLRQLLPFRLVYAIRLLDAGLVEKAYRYLTAIGNELILDYDEYYSSMNNRSDDGFVNPVLYSLMSNCLRLAEPLQHHPEIDSFDVQLNNDQMDRGFGFALMSMPQISHMNNKNKNWIGRLNQIYEQMNIKINHPHYRPADFQSYPVAQRNEDNALSSPHHLPSDATSAVNTGHALNRDSNYYNYSSKGFEHTSSAEYQKPNYQNTIGGGGGGDPYNRDNNAQRNESYGYHQAKQISRDSMPALNNNERSTAPSLFPSSSVRSKDVEMKLQAGRENELNPSSSSFNQPFTPHQQISSGHQMSTKQSPNTFVQQQHQHHQQQQPPHHHHQQQQQQQYSPPVSNTQRHFEFTSGAVNDSSSLHLPKSLSSSSPSNRYPSTAQSSHAYADDGNNDNDNLRKLNSTSYSPQHHSTLPSSYNNTNYQPASGNNTFFTPIPHTDSQTDISSTGNTQQGFDYFANIQSIQSRSRTVSGTSEHSTGGATNTSTPFIDKTTGAVNSRNNSSLTRSRENSFGNDRHYQQQLQQQQQQSQQLSMNSTSQGTMRFSHSMPMNQQSTTREDIKEDYNSERLSEEKSKEQGTMDNKNQQQSKDGWLSGWFGRLKKNGAKNIHLPDDSKPSIVWDDRLKQWIDVNDPEGSESNKIPPPPPASSFLPKTDQDEMLKTSNSSQLFPSTLSNSPPAAYSSSSSSRLSNPRSRYVNIMANQTVDMGGNILQPPLPHTARL